MIQVESSSKSYDDATAVDGAPLVTKNAANEASNAQLFAVLWALYFLVHQLKHMPWDASLSPALAIVRTLMMASAIAVIWRPNNARLFVTMITLQVASVLILLPGMSNCWMFTGIAGLGILVAAVRTRFKTKPFTTTAIYEEAVPLLRVGLITFYSLAALAKYNRDFLDPDASCAAYIAYLFADSFHLPAWDFIGYSGVAGALIVETAIPLMLFLPATRRYAVMLGLVFHTLLAHNPKVHVFDFNAMLFALYVTFTPDNLAKKLWADAIARSTWLVAVVRNRVRIVLTLAMISSLLIAFALIRNDDFVLHQFRSRLWLVIGCVISVIAFRGLFLQQHGVSIRRPFRLRGFVDYAVVALVLFNGMSPYLGLKTVASYTMFSNLRTETGYENHLLIPKSWKLFDLQDNPVQIVASTSPELSHFADSGELLLLFDLRLRAQEHPEDSLTYLDNGRRIEVARIGDDPLLGKPLPYLAKKCLIFRPIRLNSNTPQW